MHVEVVAVVLIYVFSAIGIIYAGFCAFKISESEPKVIEKTADRISINKEQLDALKETASLIEQGANTFLLREYIFLIVFLLIFINAIIFLAEQKLGYFYITAAFLIGSQVSFLCGFIGMKVATKSNIRTAYRAW